MRGGTFEGSLCFLLAFSTADTLLERCVDFKPGRGSQASGNKSCLCFQLPQVGTLQPQPTVLAWEALPLCEGWGCLALPDTPVSLLTYLYRHRLKWAPLHDALLCLK